MLRAAAEGHRTLTEGQGAELCWARSPKTLTSMQVLDIFRRKTAPAFEVALRVGGALAGTSEDVRDVFTKYSEALGIAYQIRDDLDDLTVPARRTTSPRCVRRCRWPSASNVRRPGRRRARSSPPGGATATRPSAARPADRAERRDRRRRLLGPRKRRFARSPCSTSRRSRACFAASSQDLQRHRAEGLVP
jgi:hypothetical protein